MILKEDTNYINFLKQQYNECLEKCVKDKAGDTKIRSQSVFNSFAYPCKNGDCYKLKYLIDQQEKKDKYKEGKTKHESSLNNYLSNIQESLFISDKPLVYKYDEWKNSKNGKLFIIGPSGSGKSTIGKEMAKKYNCKFIEIDDYTNIMEEKLLKRKDPELLKTEKKSGAYWKVVHANTIRYILSIKEKTVAEGIQPLWFNFDELKSKSSIIFLRTSRLISLWRATIRNLSSLWNVRVWNELKDFEEKMIKLKKNKMIKEQIGGDSPDLGSAHSFDGNNSFNANNMGDAGNYIKKNSKWEINLCIKRCDKIYDPNFKIKCIEKCKKR